MSAQDGGSPAPATTPDPDGAGLSRFGGRMGVKLYWLAMLGLFVLVVLMFGALASMNAPTHSSGGGAMIVLGCLFLGYLGWMMILRLHDYGWSGWWFVLLGPLPVAAIIGVNAGERYLLQSNYSQQTVALLVLWVEVVSFALLFGGLLLLGLSRGAVGPNRYGPDPVAPEPN